MNDSSNDSDSVKAPQPSKVTQSAPKTFQEIGVPAVSFADYLLAKVASRATPAKTDQTRADAFSKGKARESEGSVVDTHVQNNAATGISEREPAYNPSTLVAERGEQACGSTPKASSTEANAPSPFSASSRSSSSSTGERKCAVSTDSLDKVSLKNPE